MSDGSAEEIRLRQENARLLARMSEDERRAHEIGLQHRARVVEVSEELVLAQDALRRAKKEASEATKRAAGLERTLDEMKASTTWRIGRAVVAPLSRLRRR